MAGGQERSDSMGTVTFEFDGSVVVVTGANNGIGRAIACAFGHAGAFVVTADLAATPRDGGLPTHEAIRNDSGEAAFVETDVSDPDRIESVIEAAREYGGVDVMVNNAGFYRSGSLLDVDRETFERTVSVNVGGVFFGCRAAARDMLDRNQPGVIINLSSINAEQALFDQVPYAATKGAVRMITRGAALELAEHGIRVNAVAPGIVATEFGSWDTRTTERVVAEGKTTKPVPLERAGRPEDVASAALYLASDAASYVTGTQLFVDGGYHVL